LPIVLSVHSFWLPHWYI